MQFMWTCDPIPETDGFIDRLYEKCNAVICNKDEVPETFVADMHLLFGIDLKNDFIGNVFYSGNGEDLSDADLIIIPENVDTSRFLVTLADYINAGMTKRGLDCFVHDGAGVLRRYTVVKDDDSIDGGGDIFVFYEPGVFTGEVSLSLTKEIVYGYEAECGEPSQIAKDIKGGKHFTKSLWLELFNIDPPSSMIKWR